MTSENDDLPDSGPVPEYRPRSYTDYLDEQRCLWWNASQTRWFEISYEAFVRARGSFWITQIGGPAEGEVLKQIGPGDHRFVVCVMDDSRTTCLNFFAHRYVINADGLVEAFPTTLTADDEAEFKRLDLQWYTSGGLSDVEEERYKRLRDEQWEVTRIPPDLLIALKRDIPWGTEPGDHPRGGFWAAYHMHSRAVETLASQFGVTP